MKQEQIACQKFKSGINSFDVHVLILENNLRGNNFYSDFLNGSNGIFVLGVGFFFFRQISTF